MTWQLMEFWCTMMLLLFSLFLLFLSFSFSFSFSIFFSAATATERLSSHQLRRDIIENVERGKSKSWLETLRAINIYQVVKASKRLHRSTIKTVCVQEKWTWVRAGVGQTDKRRKIHEQRKRNMSMFVVNVTGRGLSKTKKFRMRNIRREERTGKG